MRKQDGAGAGRAPELSGAGSGSDGGTGAMASTTVFELREKPTVNVKGNPFLTAISEGNISEARELARAEGFTLPPLALHVALQYKSEVCIAWLLSGDLSIDFSAVDGDGNSAAVYAAAYEDMQNFQTLLDKRGTRVNEKNNAGISLACWTLRYLPGSLKKLMNVSGFSLKDDSAFECMLLKKKIGPPSYDFDTWVKPTAYFDLMVQFWNAREWDKFEDVHSYLHYSLWKPDEQQHWFYFNSSKHEIKLRDTSREELKEKVNSGFQTVFSMLLKSEDKRVAGYISSLVIIFNSIEPKVDEEHTDDYSGRRGGERYRRWQKRNRLAEAERKQWLEQRDLLFKQLVPQVIQRDDSALFYELCKLVDEKYWTLGSKQLLCEAVIQNDAVEIYKVNRDKLNEVELWFAAAKAGAMKLLKFLGQNKPYLLFEKDFNHRSALFHAANNAHWDAVDYLKGKSGEDLNAADALGSTALIEFLRASYRLGLDDSQTCEQVQQFVFRGAKLGVVANDGAYPLKLAVELGLKQTTKYLLGELGLNKEQACRRAIDELDQHQIKFFWPQLSDEQQADILRELIAAKKTAALAFLASRYNLSGYRFKVQLDQRTNMEIGVLVYAAAEGNVAMVEKLLAVGMSADVADTEGRSALWFAIRQKQQAVAQLLLRNMSSVAIQGQNRLLPFAVINGDADIVGGLLGKNANLLASFGDACKLPYEYAVDEEVRSQLAQAAQLQLFAEAQAGDITAERLALFERAGADLTKSVSFGEIRDRLIHVLLRRGVSVLGGRELLNRDSLYWRDLYDRSSLDIIVADDRTELKDKITPAMVNLDAVLDMYITDESYASLEFLLNKGVPQADILAAIKRAVEPDEIVLLLSKLNRENQLIPIESWLNSRSSDGLDWAGWGLERVDFNSRVTSWFVEKEGVSDGEWAQWTLDRLGGNVSAGINEKILTWFKAARAEKHKQKLELLWCRLPKHHQQEELKIMLSESDTTVLEIIFPLISDLPGFTFPVAVASGGDVREQEESALAFVVAYGCLGAVNLLLQPKRFSSDDIGRAFIYALMTDKLEIGGVLLDQIDAEWPHFQFALNVAVKHKQVAMVTQLLGKNVDVLKVVATDNEEIKAQLKQAAQRQLFAEAKKGDISPERLALFESAGADVNKSIDFADSGDRLIHILLRRGVSVLGGRELLTPEVLDLKDGGNVSCVDMIVKHSGTFKLMQKLIRLLDKRKRDNNSQHPEEKEKFKAKDGLTPIYAEVLKTGRLALVIALLKEDRGFSHLKDTQYRTIALELYGVCSFSREKNIVDDVKAVEERSKAADKVVQAASPSEALEVPGFADDARVADPASLSASSTSETVAVPSAPAEPVSGSSALPPALAAAAARGEGAGVAMPSARAEPAAASSPATGSSRPRVPMYGGFSSLFPSVSNDELDPVVPGGVEESKSSEPEDERRAVMG